MNILSYIRKNKLTKFVSWSLNIALLSNNVYPLLALSDGPKTPESSGFSSIQPGENVNLYTGDFQYTIPLFEMEGYPFTLTYDSNISMEQEASWVGLGWNLDIGSIDRQMRGLPDDAKGDIVYQQDNIRPNITVQLGIGIQTELIGLEPSKIKFLSKVLKKLKSSGSSMLSLSYNNYNGILWNLSNNTNIVAGNLFSKSPNTEFNAKLSLGYTIGSGGINLAPNFSIGAERNNTTSKTTGNVGFGFNLNSMTGIQGVNFGYDIQSQSIVNYTKNVMKDGNINKENTHLSIQTGNNGNISYQLLSIPPVGNLRYNNYSGGISVKLPAEMIVAGIGASAMGNFGMQKLSQKQRNLNAYGYFYMQNKIYSGDELTDVYREKDVPYMPGIPSLPQPHVQPDIFNVHTKAISGIYRAFKNTAVLTGDPDFTASKGTDLKLDFEFGGGNLFKGAINPTYGPADTKTNYWKDKNQAWGSHSVPNAFSNPFENIYFKRTNDGGNGISSTYLSYIGNDYPVKYNILKSGIDNYALINNIPNLFQPKYSQLPDKSTSFLPLTYGIIKKHPLYSALYQSYYNGLTFTPKDHLVTHIEITADNGKRLVFGCPAFNFVQKEVSFNTSTHPNNTSHTVPYSPGTDNTVNNQNGMNHYFHSQTLPPYVYAYHLTQIYSENYSDLTSDGPTPDDPGSYLLFHYTKKISNYKWRSLMDQNSAQFNPGYFSKKDDDLGMYSYGEKDVWYVDTIKSKFEVAVFYTSNRLDAIEVSGENGGQGSRSLQKLDSIIVYDTQELMAYKKNASKGLFPKKRIHFIYDYQLCPNTPNSVANNRGKLTLTTLQIYNGYNYNEQRSKYVFTYHSFNPPYSKDNLDRWGYHKSSDLLKGLFPYTPQDSVSNQNAANAWKLIKIEQPGGGTIEIEYEPDSYRYVQNKKATRMFKLTGISSSNNSFSTSGTINNNITNNWLIIETDIPSSYSLSQAQSEFNKYFEEDVMQKMYFKVKSRVTMTNSNAFTPTYEYVHGFAEIWNKNLFQHNNKWYGAIQLKAISYNGISYHPFEMATMQLVMTALPHFYQDKLPYNGSDNPVDLIQWFVADVSANLPFFLNQFIALLAGPFKYMKLKGIGSEIIPTESWIRLCVRDKKYGGGSRVKEIRYKNNWQSRTGENNADINYIKQYKYIMEDGTCSGVAANEPMTSADENSWRTGLLYHNTTSSPALLSWARALSPKTEYLYYYPLNESDLPAPSVNYKRVVVLNSVPSPYKSKGWEVHEFYTHQEYPVTIQQTPIEEYTPKQNISAYYVNISRTHAVVSQGFCTILNDMPGKQKQTLIYDADSNLISKHAYYYTLDKINFMKDNGTLEKNYNDCEADVVVDWREQKSHHSSYRLEVNLDVGTIPPYIPIIVPTAWPFMDYSETFYRSSAINKTIYRHATLIKEEITERGADLTVTYKAWDIVTGNPLVKGIKEKFGKEEYTYELPAYKVYPQMSSSSKNEGLLGYLSTNGTGQITCGITTNCSPFHYKLFGGTPTDGDQVLDLISGSFYWLYKNGSSYYLMDANGNTVTNLSKHLMYWYRSGYKNRLTETTEQIQTQTSPITGNVINISVANHILNASATTYTDYYSIPADSCKYSCTSTGCSSVATIQSNKNYSFSCTGGLMPVGTTSASGISIPIQIGVKEPCGCNGSIYVSSCYSSIDSIYFAFIGSVLRTSASPEKNLSQKKPAPTDSTANYNPCAPIAITKSVSCVGTCDGSIVLNFTNTTCSYPLQLDWSLTGCTPLPTLTLVPAAGSYTISNVCACGSPYFINIKDVNNNYIGGYTLGYVPGPALINIHYSNIVPPCQNQCNGSMDLIVGGGTPPYTVTMVSPSNVSSQFTPGINNSTVYANAGVQTLTNLCSGTYTFNVQDHNGCTKTSTINLNQSNSFYSAAMASLCPGTYEVKIKLHNVAQPVSVFVTLTGGNTTTLPYFKINPFIHHLRNAWRPYESYLFLTSRVPSTVTQPVHLPVQSYFTNFTKFWTFGSSGWTNNSTSWKLIHTITYCDINGHPIEEKDINGKYSSAWFNVFRGLQEGIIYNARTEEVGFDSFEYYYPDSTHTEPPRHFYSKKALPRLTLEEAHTGWHSVKLNTNDSILYLSHFTSLLNKKNWISNSSPSSFSVYPAMVADRFAPFDSTRTYLVSVWVKSTVSAIKPDTNLLGIYVNNQPSYITKIYESPSIEGWKQYRYRVRWGEINPKACDKLRIIFTNHQPAPFYLDDVKIEPEDAESKVYVYHPYRKFLMAVLDENHFATKYIYNMRNELEKTIKETEKGNVYVQYKKKEQK